MADPSPQQPPLPGTPPGPHIAPSTTSDANVVAAWVHARFTFHANQNGASALPAKVRNWLIADVNGGWDIPPDVFGHIITPMALPGFPSPVALPPPPPPPPSGP